MIFVIAIALVFVIYLLRYVLNNLMNKGFDAVENSMRQNKNIKKGPEIVRLADLYPYEAARHQHNGTAYAFNPMLLAPENGPYQQANPYVQANPYININPYAQANPYVNTNPYAQANTYVNVNPYMKAAPGSSTLGNTAPVMATVESGNANAEHQDEKAMVQNEKVWECLTCHHLNRDSAKICKICGQIKAKGFKTISPNSCPGCGNEIEPTDKFCSVCGYKLKTEE